MPDSPHALAVLDLEQRRDRPGGCGRTGILRPLDARTLLAADMFGTAALVVPTWVYVARDPLSGYHPTQRWNGYKVPRWRNQASANRRHRHTADAKRARENYRSARDGAQGHARTAE